MNGQESVAESGKTPPAVPAPGAPDRAGPHEPLLLDAQTIARVTEGKWRNLPLGAVFTGVSVSRHQQADGLAGHLHCVLESDPRDSPVHRHVVSAARGAFADGALAVMVPGAVPGLPPDWPLLEVEDVAAALERLAFHVRDRLFTGRRVLVSGTRGSHAFKSLLHHVLSAQMPAHALGSDSGDGHAIMASLASIRVQDQIAIIEASLQPAGRLARRSGYVRPQMAVITDVDIDDAASDRKAQDAVDACADIAMGLAQGGFCLINADSKAGQRLQRSLQARRRIPLSSFGSDAHCPGRLIEQRFADNQWCVTASIEGQTVQYRLPLVDEWTPLLSVAVLLAAYYLGADIEHAAHAMARYRPPHGAGAMCQIACPGGWADLYASSAPATAADRNAFAGAAARLMAREAGGRRIAVLGPVTSHPGEVGADAGSLVRWVDEVQADIVVLVGPRMVALRDELRHPERVVQVFPGIGRRHTPGPSAQALYEAIGDLLHPGDLLLMAGDLPAVVERLRSAVAPPADRRSRTDVPAAAAAAADAAPVELPAPYVVDRDGIRSLHLDSVVRQGIMRIDRPDALLWEYARHMMGWLLFVDPDSVVERHAVQLGLGAGSLTKACRNRLEVKTTAIELNPAVIRLCRDSFNLPPDDHLLQVIEGDAACQLRLPQWQGRVDALQVDLFDARAAAPVFDGESFFADCRAVLTRDGCVTFNTAGRESSVPRTLDNMGRIFGRLALWSFARCATGNTVILAQRLPSRPSRRTLQLRAREIQRRWGFSATEWVDSLESWVA